MLASKARRPQGLQQDCYKINSRAGSSQLQVHRLHHSNCFAPRQQACLQPLITAKGSDPHRNKKTSAVRAHQNAEATISSSYTTQSDIPKSNTQARVTGINSSTNDPTSACSNDNSSSSSPSAFDLAQQPQSPAAAAALPAPAAACASPTPATPARPSPSKKGHGGMAQLLQNFNAAGIGLFFKLFGGSQALAIPHLSVPDIRCVDWAAMRAAGFKGVIFDKDNTLTMPFALEVDPRLVRSLARCKEAFGTDRVVLYSNSAGLKQYDPQGKEAAALEAALGVAVLRHEEKKPAGASGEVEAHFGCTASELVMVGDRYLTDIVFGNRHGMLTVRPAPLTEAGEPAGVVLARRVEDFFVARWSSQGVAAPPHRLLPADGSVGHLMLPAEAEKQQ